MGTIVDPELMGLNSILAKPQEAINTAEGDMNFLGALCFPEIMKFPFPVMFLAMWALLKSKINLTRDFSKIALGIPRGFAKTTFIKLFIIYIILFTKKSFIAVISYGEDHAISILSDVCSMLSHPNIQSLFGDWTINKKTDQASTKVFVFRNRTIILKAVGAKGGIRGINYEHRRPDVMIFEDYQKKAEAENEEVAKKLYEEMVGTAMKANDPFGCLYIYIGNMFAATGSILRKLKENEDWESLVVGAILADGTSLWEDLQPIEQLLKEYASDLRAGVPQVFLAEKLNDENAGIKAGIDITVLPKFPFDDNEIPVARGIVIDPSLDNPNSDYNGIGLIGIFDGIPTLEDVDLGKYSPLALIKNALKMAFRTSTRLIAVENKAYQASLLFWFGEVVRQNKLEQAGFIFLPLNTGTASKNAKIAAALKKYVAGEIYVKDKPRILLVNEIIKWNPMKKNNQDTCLDLLCFADTVKEQYEHQMLMPYEAEVLTNGAEIGVRSEAETCSF